MAKEIIKITIKKEDSMDNSKSYKNIDEYINLYPSDVREILEQLRNEIKSVAPEAIEVISYNMPAFKMNEVLVYFAAYKKHIGFYPTPDAITEFKDELAPYKSSKGAVQFPLDKPLPLDLIRRMVKYRIDTTNK